MLDNRIVREATITSSMQHWYEQLSDRVSKTIYRHLPAFKWRNFRLLFGGQLLSMSGTFMTQQLTIPWLVYDLTKSAWLLGLAGFLQFLPTLLLIPFSGVLADRWSRRDLLMLVQVLGIRGSLAQLMDAPTALIICGGTCILGAMWFSSQVTQVSRWIKREIDSPVANG